MLARWTLVGLLLLRVGQLPVALAEESVASHTDAETTAGEKTAPAPKAVKKAAPKAAPGKESWFAPVAEDDWSCLPWNKPWDKPRHPANLNEPRSDIWIPVVSFLLPGYGQFANGQCAAGAAYATAAIAGYTYAGNIWASDHLQYAQDQVNKRAKAYGDNNPPSALDQKYIAERKYTLGLLVAQAAGGMSLYHDFRMSVTTRQQHGQYGFLGHEETTPELYKDLFRFEYLTRASTWIPLAVGAGIAYLQVHATPANNMVKDSYSSADAFFTGAYSFNAGTHEEAIFRGWLMPVLREYTGSDLWSNAIQGLAFAAAHLNTVQAPLPQLLLGWDLGYISQHNGWAIGEGVFIHAWWDVMAFWAEYQYTWKYANSPIAIRQRPVLWLPPFQWEF